MKGLLRPAGLDRELFSCEHALPFESREEQFLGRFGNGHGCLLGVRVAVVGPRAPPARWHTPEALQAGLGPAEGQRRDHHPSWSEGRITSQVGLEDRASDQRQILQPLKI